MEPYANAMFGWGMWTGCLVAVLASRIPQWVQRYEDGQRSKDAARSGIASEAHESRNHSEGRSNG